MLAIVTAVGGVLGLMALLTGRYPTVNWSRVSPLGLIWWALGLLVGAWAVKIFLGLLDGSLPAR